MSDLNEKIKTISENENVQKAKEAASNAGKKLDEGITNAVDGIKSSDTYNKVMSNENVQKVMNSEAAKKATGFWGKLGNKAKYIVCGVAVVLVVVIIANLFGGSTVKLKSEESIQATKCSHKCKAGKVGFSSSSETSGTLYFSAKDETKVYRIESEDGQKVETVAEESAIYGRDNNGSSLFKYDTKLIGEDEDEDGYVEYTISYFTGSKYKKVCKVKGKTK